MVINKWLAGLLVLAITALTGWQAILPGGVSVTEGWQYAGLVVTAIGAVGLPLVEGRWRAGLKVGVAVLGAAFAAIVPLATGGYTAEAVVIVALAALNAAAVQVGVAVRLDSAAAVLADSQQSNAKIETIDKPAVLAVAEEGMAH